MKALIVCGLVIFGILVSVTLAGCGPQGGEPFVKEPTNLTPSITVKFLNSPAEVAKFCPIANVASCTLTFTESGNSVLYLVKPKNWAYGNEICAAGHELMHAMGATHKNEVALPFR